ncbi:MAG: leucine-rich repeat domain-containing protein, partial [Alistipes sp.]|nr:leucine-rich repeat domain-containing protein [Alistipes sp.]
FIGNSNHYGIDTHGNAVSLAGNNIKVDGLTFKNCVLKDDTNNNRLLYKSESTTHVHKYVFNGEEFTFTPSLKNITITDCTFDGGYMGLELREAENVTITNNEFKVADRNILLPVNSGYTYSGAITITGNTSINAKERFVRADGTGDAVVVIKNNRILGYQGADADYIKVTNGNNVTIEDNECITGAYATVSTAEELASIINNATKDTTVVLAADLEGKIELWQNAAVNITINGNGKKYTGAIRIINIGGATDRSLTIKNINFDGTGITTSEGCIYTSLGVTVNGQGYNSYIANVTVENCHFTGDSTTAAFRQNNGGDINLTLKNCEVDSTMHSFVQAKNFKNTLTAVDCKVNSKNGVNLNNTHDASFTGCEFDVKGYAVRVGVNDNSDTVLKTYNFTSCTLKSECQDGDAVVIVRNTAKDATLTFVDCEVEGSTIISGITSDTIVNGIELPQLNNQIWYTATSLVHAHWYKDKFGVGTDLVSNVWDETTGKGVITLSGDVTKIGQNAFYYDGFHDSRENLISISLPSTVTEIGEAAFGHCPNLTTVTFNNNLVTIGPSAFIGCAKLTNVVLPESLVTIGDSAFNSCTSLKSITIPAGVTSIGNFAFNGISEIKVYCKPTTPPTVGSTPFNKWWAEIYVPTASLAAYQQAWGGVADNIYDGGF